LGIGVYFDPIEVVGIALEAPPVRVAGQGHWTVGLELPQDERPGAVGVARGVVLLPCADVDRHPRVMGRRPALRHDGDVSHLFPELRVRELGLDVHGVLVDRAHPGDALDAGGEA
jgi:hypothetical protein